MWKYLGAIELDGITGLAYSTTGIAALISPLLGMVSRKLWRIHIDGTLDEPNPPDREPLPELNESLRNLFPEFDGQDAVQRRSERQRNANRDIGQP